MRPVLSIILTSRRVAGRADPLHISKARGAPFEPQPLTCCNFSNSNRLRGRLRTKEPNYPCSQLALHLLVIFSNQSGTYSSLKLEPVLERIAFSKSSIDTAGIHEWYLLLRVDNQYRWRINTLSGNLACSAAKTLFFAISAISSIALNNHSAST